jgi:cell division protein FtsA
MAATPDNLIVGLDIGTHKVVIVAAERDSDGNVTYVGGGQREARGVRNGVVVDIPDVATCIEEALYDAEGRAERKLTNVCVGVSGPHVQGHLARGTIAPMGRDITHDDVTRAIVNARAGLPLSQNREVIHEIPRAYAVDGQPGIRDPHGMAGYELEVEVHYATGLSTTISNLVKCVRQARLNPLTLVAAPMAAGEAVRPADEHADCFAVADIGAQTTDLVLYAGGSVWTSATLAMGGDDVTRDIVTQFRLPWQAAEQLKRHDGHCLVERVPEFDLAELPATAGVTDAAGFVPRRALAEVIGDRAQRFAERLRDQLEPAQVAGLEPEALYITGGGSRLAGLAEVLTGHLEIPVYGGTVHGVRGLPPLLDQPAYATVLGLVLWQARYTQYPEYAAAARGFSLLPELVGGVRKWLRVVLP